MPACRVACSVSAALAAALLLGCNAPPIEPPSAGATDGRGATGVLLVSHGSHSPNWRRMLTELGERVTPRLTAIDGVGGVKSAFMEYTEPSIATQLKAFDAEGYDRVVLVPLLLTVSSHSFDDIPTIIGAKEDAKSLAMLEAEGIERYTPRAELTVAPLLDYSALLEENLPRRIAALSEDPASEGVLLVAYGSEPFNAEWESFFTDVGDKVREKTGVASVAHCWCGHIARYSGEPTKQGVAEILAEHDRALVIPVLVAVDENFQLRIIGTAVEEAQQQAGDPSRVAYVPDAILPDERLNDWVVAATRDAIGAPSAPPVAPEGTP